LQAKFYFEELFYVGFQSRRGAPRGEPLELARKEPVAGSSVPRV
jgi:hypothetical protein